MRATGWSGSENHLWCNINGLGGFLLAPGESGCKSAGPCHLYCPQIKEQPQASGATGNDDFSAKPPNMYKINDIGSFVGRSLTERDLITVLLNNWSPSSSYDFPVAYTGFQKRRFQIQWLEEFEWIAYSEIHKGAFKWCVAFVPDVVSRSAKPLGMLVKSAHKNWKKAKEDYKSQQTRQYHRFCAEKLNAFLKL